MLQGQLDAGTNRVAITCSADEPKRQIVMVGRSIVPQESQLRSTTIDDPKVDIPVQVPIGSADSPRIVSEIETAQRRNIGEPTFARIQETAVPLAAAKRDTTEDPTKLAPIGLRASIHVRRRNVDRRTALRQNLPPEKTSQIAIVIGRDEPVGDQQVFPSIVVHVDKQRTPRPSSDLDGGLGAHFAETLAANIFE